MREKYFTVDFSKIYSDKPKEASHTSQKSRNLSIESYTSLYRLLIPKPTTTRLRVKDRKHSRNEIAGKPAVRHGLGAKLARNGPELTLK